MIKDLIKKPLFFFRCLFFDPVAMVRRWMGIPWFISNLARYGRMNKDSAFRPRLRDWHYSSHDRYMPAGSAIGHYFHQDLWAARILLHQGVAEHVDVGSRLDGFVAHLLTFAKVTYVDLRPLDSQVDGLEFREGTILSLPFADDSVSSLSSLHVVEHIGLGRYGDPVDPQGYVKALRELARVLKPGGDLLLGVPVGRERVRFDAHRIFHPATILKSLPELELVEFSLIDDTGVRVISGAPLELAAKCDYGCGLFHFRKAPANR